MDFFRRFFCKHEYEHIKDINIYLSSYSEMPYKIKRVYICPKCLKKRVIKY